MQCQFAYVRSTLWRCKQCGREVGTYWLAEGVLAPPKPARLPPCGWRPLVVDAQGHLWVEQPPVVAQTVDQQNKPAEEEKSPLPAAGKGNGEGVSSVIPAQAGAAENRRWRCQQCFQEVRLPPETTDAEARQTLALQAPCPKPRPAPPAGKPPGLAQQAVSYAKAVAGWLAEGRPVRPPAEIERIFSICQACDRYDRQGSRCLRCGCRVNESDQAWKNKIAMATQSCPLGKW